MWVSWKRGVKIQIESDHPAIILLDDGRVVQMTNDQREIHRKKRVLEYAERIGNIKKACRYFGVARSTFYLWRDRSGGHLRENFDPNPEFRVIHGVIFLVQMGESDHAGESIFGTADCSVLDVFRP